MRIRFRIFRATPLDKYPFNALFYNGLCVFSFNLHFFIYALLIVINVCLEHTQEITT